MIAGNYSFAAHVKEIKFAVYHSGKHQLLHCICIKAHLQKKDACEEERRGDLDVSIRGKVAESRILSVYFITPPLS